MLLVLANMDSDGQSRVSGAHMQQVWMPTYDPDQFGATGTQQYSVVGVGLGYVFVRTADSL